MESIQIHLNAENADIVQNSISDCIFYLPQMNINSQSEIFLSVQSATIPFSFYQVNSSNNFLMWSIYSQSVVNTVTIPEGNYNINEMVTYLNANMTNMTVTYNVKTNKLTFTNLVGGNWQFTNSSTCDLLGLTFPSYSSNFSITSTNSINLNKINNICILTNFKTKSFVNNKTNGKIPDRNLLCSFPIEVNRNSSIIYHNRNNFRINTYTNNIHQIEIKICDSNGNIINLNGCNWCLTLQFDIFRFAN